METIDGTKIISLFTIGSMYANGKLIVKFENEKGNREEGRIDVEDILKMVNKFNFELEQKRTYKHLINPTLVSPKY